MVVQLKLLGGIGGSDAMGLRDLDTAENYKAAWAQQPGDACGVGEEEVCEQVGAY